MFILPTNELFSVSEMTPVWSKKPVTHMKVHSSKDSYDLIRPIYPQLDMYESFWVILLDRSNTVMGISNISIGSATGTVADPKKIFSHALITNASSIICVHNHPSNNIKPSAADIAVTKKIREAGIILDLKLLDHLIIGTGHTYYSFADEGAL